MLITRGTRGDIQPFVALARGLILEQNCDVVFVTELPWKKFVKAATEDLPRGRLRFRPCGGDTSRRVSGDLARYVLSLGQQSVALQALVFSRSEVEFFPSEGCFFHWAWEERPTFIVFGFLLIHVAMIISEASAGWSCSEVFEFDGILFKVDADGETELNADEVQLIIK
ncbi:unnamed protein product [Effrenium voratum]|uniref:Glycosyltransferase family 28 N-terminal domain-containing protein n=1 Tax=Effrenium voratum TaxID=2562239 RepID=A0AA36IFE0_9DINO|nr:unnamed protein product [Effrenium voratum]